MLYINHHQP